MTMMVWNSVGETRHEAACSYKTISRGFFALVNLILTKRQARCGRAKTAKNGANRLWGEDFYPG